MWYRFAVIPLLSSVLGCGDSSGEGPEPPTPSSSSPDESQSDGSTALPEGTELPETGFTLTVDGWSEPLEAKAELNVTEGVRTVSLAVIATAREDLLMLDVPYDGVEETIGTHRGEVGLPGKQVDSALASIDGKSYQSQGGFIELSLNADGTISGRFELALAEIIEVEVGLPIAFEAGEVVRTLSGRFGGEWELFCQSRLPGHRTLVPGGDYCEELELD